MMRLATLLSPKLLSPNLTGCDKMEAVRKLLDMIAAEDKSINTERIWEKIVEREEIEDTSYGRGFAFPHARTDEVRKMYLAIGVSAGGLDACKDGSQLDVVCLLLTPSSISKLYLQTVSALANFARTEPNLKLLKEATTPAEMMDVFWNSGVMVNKEITVGDLMRYDPVVVRENQTLREIANMMFRHRLSALPVVDSNGYLLGFVSDRDLLTAALPDYKALASSPDYELPVEPFEELLRRADQIDVSQFYQMDCETVHPDSDIVRTSARMLEKHLRRIYVVDDSNKLVGSLHRKDIVNMILRG